MGQRRMKLAWSGFYSVASALGSVRPKFFSEEVVHAPWWGATTNVNSNDTPGSAGILVGQSGRGPRQDSPRR
ncbi:MAG: hypothetical protein HY232_11025 [Acidobacteria bacterium]|nr:hypothetical protein [Acidobacteriota bacterium]